MQQQPDKEFDAILRDKMREFSAEPPAELWGVIDKEINRPAGKGKSKGYGWLKIAASLCLLALAGLWFYNYEGPVKKDMLSAVPRHDSAAEENKPKVTILNKSRQRNETGEEKKNEKVEETEQRKEENQEQQEINITPASPAPAGRHGKELISGNTVPGKTAFRLADQEATIPVSTNPEAADAPEPADLELPVIAGVNPGQENPGREIAFVESSSLGLAAESSLEPVTKTGKNSLIPKEIKELSGVGEALNLMASTIDKSEDKFIQVGKDERSGKWNGLSLDLGIVTISYNKPEKKKND